MKSITKKKFLIVAGVILIVILSKFYNHYFNPSTGGEKDVVPSGTLTTTPSPSIVPSSSSDTVLEEEIPFDELEPENSENTIFYNGMEDLYEILKYNEVEVLRVNIDSYIKSNFKEHSNECIVTILENSENTLKVNFELDKHSMVVTINKDMPLVFNVEGS